MSQSISLNCHGRGIKGFCTFDECQSTRLFCLSCIKDHYKHDDETTSFIQEIENLEKWFADKFQFAQELLHQLDELKSNIMKSFTIFQKYINQFQLDPNTQDLSKLSLTQLNNIMNQNLKLSKYSNYMENVIKPFNINFENILKIPTLNQETKPKNYKTQHLIIGNFLSKTQGDILKGHQHYDQAIQMYELALEVDEKEQYLALWNIADCLKKLQSYEKAIIYYDKALDSPNNNYIGSLLGKGYCLTKLSQYKQAEIYFRKALEIDPKLQDAKDGLNIIRMEQF